MSEDKFTWDGGGRDRGEEGVRISRWENNRRASILEGIGKRKGTEWEGRRRKVDIRIT